MPSECNFLSSSDDAYEFECLVAYETLPIDTDVFPECVPLYSQADFALCTKCVATLLVDIESYTVSALLYA